VAGYAVDCAEPNDPMDRDDAVRVEYRQDSVLGKLTIVIPNNFYTTVIPAPARESKAKLHHGICGPRSPRGGGDDDICKITIWNDYILHVTIADVASVVPRAAEREVDRRLGALDEAAWDKRNSHSGGSGKV